MFGASIGASIGGSIGGSVGASIGGAIGGMLGLGGSNPDPPVSHRFLVSIDGVPSGVFTECDLPSFEIVTDAEIQEGGRAGYTIQLPGPLKPGRLSLKRGLVLADQVLDWYFNIIQWTFHKGGLYKNVTVTLYQGATPGLTIGFINAYPVKWQGPSLKADTTAVAVEAIDFIYETIVVEKGQPLSNILALAGGAGGAISAGISASISV
ncbi:MAG: phage tail protein [Aggregatilineales bacterium]